MHLTAPIDKTFNSDNCLLEKYILDNANIAVWSYDTNMHYTYFNELYKKTITQLTGHEPQLGELITSHFSEDLVKIWTPLYKKALNGEFIEKELVITREPTLFGTLTQFNPIKDESGNVVGAFVFSRNVTSKIEAEERLRKSEEFLKKFINVLPIPIFAKNKNHEYILVNEKFSQITNRSTNEFSGKTPFDIWDKDFAEKIVKQDDEVFSLGHLSSVETLFDKQGKKRTSIVLKSIQKDYEENDILIGAILDITEQKNIEEALSYEKSILRDLIDSVPDLIFFKNYEGYYIGCNKAFEKFCGKTEDWLIGHSDYDMFPKEEADEFRKMDISTMDSEKLTKFEEEVTYPDGTKVLLETIKVPIRLNNETGGIIGISRDITERKKVESELKESEEELRKANSMKDKLFSMIAHDLKNPFTALLNLTTILHTNYNLLSDDKKQDYVKKILDAAKNNYSLLENLLDWAISQMDSGHPEKKDVLVYQLVENILKTLEASLNHKKIGTEVSIDKTIELKIDENALRSVLQNLITNAIKFTHDGGKVTISAESTSEQIIISVTDTGIGMNEEKKASLFEINHSKSTPGTHNEKGSGIGLILCKEYTEKNNGTIEVESTLGKGSTFRVSFPV